MSVTEPMTVPGPKGRFLVGTLFEYLKDPLKYSEDCAREFGDVAKLNVPGMGSIMLSHPDDIESVLRSNHKDFIKDRWTRATKAFFGESLLTSDGEPWRRQRRLISPAFQLDRIQRYGQIMIDLTERTIAGWNDGETSDVHRDMMRLTLEIVAKALFDIDMASAAPTIGEALEVITDFFYNPLNLMKWRPWVPTPGLLRYKKAAAALDELIYRMIAEGRASSNAGSGGEHLLAKLLSAVDEDGTRLSDKQLRDELLTLILAGHETTALSLSFTFYLLGRNADVEAALVRELREKIGDRPVTVADFPRLTYTQNVVKESMRLYPPAWAIARESLVETEFRGLRFPKGTQFLMVQWVVHRDARWHDDPLAFRPERWDHEKYKNLHRGAYFPFGDGPRICVGLQFAMLEATLILATIARRVKLTPTSSDELELIPSITIRPKNGVPATITRRIKSDFPPNRES